jgi:predicted O-methyltransferase YrrM
MRAFDSRETAKPGLARARHYVATARRFIRARRAGRALGRESAGIQTVSAAIDFATQFRRAKLGIAPLQARQEIEPLLEILRSEEPRTVLEIGTDEGGSLFLWARVASRDAVLISVDLAGGILAGRGPLVRALGREGQRVERIKGNSHDPRTFERVKRALGERPVDFLFIDGDHSYEGARSDFETYSRLMRPGGIIALHDIVHTETPGVGVYVFWRELQSLYETQEFIAPPPRRKGIGLLRAGATTGA